MRGWAVRDYDEKRNWELDQKPWPRWLSFLAEALVSATVVTGLGALVWWLIRHV